ncbi:Patellin-4 [Thalictrum thalictroides]|uniref:Patellin-4 n=1 Tax=Thalictrum thalictroides TaxID=46969 RepID=A0A7J6X283_THATH|nr:Patellin-4 [Thalictrum thalictroides]
MSMTAMTKDGEISDDTLSHESQDFQENFDTILIEEASKRCTELKPSVKKALLRFRIKLQDAILKNYIYGRPPTFVYGIDFKGSSEDISIDSMELMEDIRDISLWGIPLLPSKGHEGTDVILLKFLQAKDFKVNEAFEMLRKTLKWRKEFETDKILNEIIVSDLDLEGMTYMDGTDRKGHPVCYVIYGAFKENDLFRKTFGSEEKIKDFLRWSVQIMEKNIQALGFKSGGANSIVQITDLKNSPGPGTKEMRIASKKAYMLFQDNYPEIIYKNILVNVPFWYYAYHSVSTRLLNQRNKSKFIFARPSKVTKTLLKFIPPANLPVQYGGLKRDNDDEFPPEYPVLETIVKPGCIDSIQVPIPEPGVTVVWDLTVVGLDVSYKEEFVPEDDCSYKIPIQMEKKMSGSVRNSFYISEPGMILLTIDNSTFKKKKVLYRLKIKPTVPMYIHQLK